MEIQIVNLIAMVFINFVVCIGFFSWRPIRNAGFVAMFLSSVLTTILFFPIHTFPLVGQIIFCLFVGSLGVYAYFVLYTRFR